MAAKKQLEIVFTPKIVNNEVRIDSRQIAEQFGRGHNNVLQSVRNIIETGELNELDFKLVDYLDTKGESRPMYEFTEDGAYIVMPFIGGASSVKGQVALVRAFRAAREQLKSQVQTPGSYLEALEALVGVERDRLRLTAEVQVLAPQANAWHQAIEVSSDLITRREAAKFLNGRGIKITQSQAISWTRDNGWTFVMQVGKSKGKEYWTAEVEKKGLGEVKMENINGLQIPVLYLTPKGLDVMAIKLMGGGTSLALAA